MDIYSLLAQNVFSAFQSLLYIVHAGLGLRERLVDDLLVPLLGWKMLPMKHQGRQDFIHGTAGIDDPAARV